MAAVYALGSNGSGQLGIGHKEDVSVPKEVIFEAAADAGPICVRAGGNHTLLLDVSGKLLCAGDFSAGACGLPSITEQPRPQFSRVQFNRETSGNEAEGKAVLCAATWEASIIVKQDSSGRARNVYSFGTGNKGELGLGELIFRTPRAQLIKDFPPAGTEVVDLASCMNHVVAVLDNGDVYGWGSGRKGQLGQPEAVVYTPRKIAGVDFKVTRVVCGREFTYLLGSSETGGHAVLGTEKWNIKASVPAHVKGWKEVGASWGSIFVLNASGEVLSWGRDDHGQLSPTDLPSVSHLAVGSEHVLALSTKGDVLAWGWGEHGNCGPSTTNGDVKGRWNVVASSQYLPVESKILSIGAGCATSWVCIGSA